MALLSRVADRIYWGARYIERAEDTARLVRSFGDVFADMPSSALGAAGAWPPLLAVAGAPVPPDGDADEHHVVRFLVTDRSRAGSAVWCVAACRENLRTTREVLPREAWQAVNDLYLYVEREADIATERRFRDRFLARIVDDSRRLDGILTSTMTRDAAFDMWRLGRYIERADMTTRVVGVRAAALMRPHQTSTPEHDEVHWMGVLRSLSALQMFQRATRTSIEASAVVRFLLYERRFPRSVAGALDEIELSLGRLSNIDSVVERLEHARRVLRSSEPSATDGADLDRSMDSLQIALAELHDAITSRFLRHAGTG